jgi:hypothetical protein
MKKGTKSILFGTHQFILHPLFVIVGWFKVYGTLPDIYTCFAIAIHDWGYWGCENMDDEEGEKHPIWASEFIEKILPGRNLGKLIRYHSRFLAKTENADVSELCLPDKVGVALYPWWLWTVLAVFAGELQEYMGDEKYEINWLVSGKNRTAKEFFYQYKNKVDEWMTGKQPLMYWKY